MLSSVRNFYRIAPILRQGQRFEFPASISRVGIRWRHSTPVNTVIMFVPQQEAWVVERMGKFYRILQPGLNILFPIIDRVKYVQSLKEIAIDIPKQSAVTADNVTLNIDGVLYLRVMDAYRASYGVEDPEFAITQLAQTTMRSELGKISLDSVFRERESLNIGIVEAINKASNAWGIDCLRYEIRDIRLPQRVQDAMQMQVEAERKKRAIVLESEGMRESDINVAEGKKQARILASEAHKMEEINQAMGEAKALLYRGEARAKAITFVAESLKGRTAHNAASLAIAEQYVAAFGKLAKNGTTVILPSDAANVGNMVTQALSVFNALQNNQNFKPGAIESNKNSDSKPNSEILAEFYSDDDELSEAQKKLQELSKKSLEDVKDS